MAVRGLVKTSVRLVCEVPCCTCKGGWMIAMEDGVGRLKWSVLKNVNPCIYSTYLRGRRSRSGYSSAFRMMTLIMLIQPSINSFSFGFARHAVGARAEYGMALTGMSPACFSCLQQTATDTASLLTIKDQSLRGRCILVLRLQRLAYLFIRLSALWSLHHYHRCCAFHRRANRSLSPLLPATVRGM